MGFNDGCWRIRIDCATWARQTLCLALGRTVSEGAVIVEQPILIFGMPRSGTTWLGKIFDSHPDTLYRHEPDNWLRPSVPLYPKAEETERYAAVIQAFAAELPQLNDLRVAGKLPLFPKSYLSRPRAHLMRGGVWLARLGSQLHIELPVFMHSAAGDYTQRRIVWKSIESMGRMGLILNALPAAKAIHIVRHPCGYIASIVRGRRGEKFTTNTVGGGDYGLFKFANNTSLGDPYHLSMDVVETLTAEERLAWRWVLLNEKALLEGETTGRALCVRYEDVCMNPLRATEQMFSFAGLDMAEQTRRFIIASTAQSDDHYYSVFKNPETAAMRWQNELTPEVIDRVMAIVQRSRFADYYISESINAQGKA